MSSVAQKVRSQPHIFQDGIEGKVCGAGRKANTGVPQCNKWYPLVEYPRNRAYEDGYGIVCKHCKKLGRKTEATASAEATQAQPLALIPGNAEQFYDAERGLYNLTAMWRAAGCPRGKRPSKWQETEQYKEFLAELNVRIGDIYSTRGGGGGTWAHWQVAVEYAGYLSPAFAIQWNEFAAAYLRGERRQDVAPAEVSAAPLVVYAEQSERNHRHTHKQLEAIQSMLEGATVYKDRVLVIRGSVYFKRLWPEIPVEAVAQLIDIPNAVEMWRKGYRPYTIGRTGKQRAEQRTEEYGGKPRMKSSPPIAEIHVDDPVEAERVLKRTRPRDVIPAEGCAEIVWAKPSIEDRVRRSWTRHPTMAVSDLVLRMRGWEIGAPVVVEQIAF